MLFNEQNGKGDEEFERVRDQKAVEMENRRVVMVKRSDTKRRLREQHIERNEASEAEKVQRSKEAAALKARQLDLTERLAKELSRRKHIELQEQIKSRKEKSAVPSLSNCMLEDIEARLIEEKKLEKGTQSSKQISVWYCSEDSEVKRQEKKLNYRRELQNQLINNRRRLREKEEEKHRERKIMEEVGETIRKEDLELEKRKRETVILLQAERDAFLKAREFWKEKRREVLKQEHDEISRIIAKKEALQKREAEQKTDTHATREATAEKLAKKLMEEERKKMEREEICRELYLAEKEDELAREAIKLATRKKRNARELLQDMARHRKVIADKKEKEDAIDAAFARYMAEERKNMEEKEKQKEQARREKTVQYGNELREAIAINKQSRLKEIEQMRPKFNANETEAKETSKNIIAWNDTVESRRIKCHSEPVLDTWKSQEQKNTDA